MAYEATARMYEYDSRFFVCSVQWIAETESLTELDASSDDKAIGEAVLRHLAEYSPDQLDLRNDKATDWPAFKTSGARSIKAFERKLWHMDLATMNSAILVWARPRLTLNDNGLSAYATGNRNIPESVGAAVRSALGAAKLLRQSGGI